jgi:2-polyprenyl-3-methyl-5-hydroxy-6-metoxy-1,4-benzoquinol methylase
MPAWIDFEEDRRRAVALSASVPPDDVEGAVAFVFRSRADWHDSLINRRVSQVLSLPDRLRGELEEWLAPIARSGPVLDVGCGSGALLSALASKGVPHLGVDVSLEWLVVADRMIRVAGGEPRLACALAEALPLATESVGSAAVLDVIEHVADPAALVREVSRVVRPGGALALATPNRFSLSAEPHVGVWGVGWLPTRLQDRYVRWRTGKPYGLVRLLSRRELQAILARHSAFSVRLAPALIPAQELQTFSGRRKLLADGYNRFLSLRPAARILTPITPFFHLVGRRR